MEKRKKTSYWGPWNWVLWNDWNRYSLGKISWQWTLHGLDKIKWRRLDKIWWQHCLPAAKWEGASFERRSAQSWDCLRDVVPQSFRQSSMIFIPNSLGFMILLKLWVKNNVLLIRSLSSSSKILMKIHEMFYSHKIYWCRRLIEVFDFYGRKDDFLCLQVIWL